MKLKRVIFGKVSIKWAMLLWIICFGSGFVLVSLFTNQVHQAWFRYDYWQSMARFGESLRVANKKYVDANLSSFENLTNHAIDGMVNSLDRHSAYYSSEEYKSFLEDTHRRYVGIGVMIRKIETGIVVTGVFPTSPAEKVGIQLGDFVLEVNGDIVEQMSLETVSSRIRGPENTTVQLKIQKGSGLEFKHTITRQKIEISSISEFSIDDDGIGYIHLRQFTERTAKEFRSTIEYFLSEDVQGMILDLRDNGGGLLSAAVEVARIFLNKDQVIVSIRGRSNLEEQIFQSEEIGLASDMPMVILVNASSASASEIVAGALMTTDRAKVIGERSFGKGSVQTIFPLFGETGLRLTTSMYFLPNGSTIHEKGIEPDYPIICNDANKTRLRIQGYGKSDFNKTKMISLFGFEPVEDTQLIKAHEVLQEIIHEK